MCLDFIDVARAYFRAKTRREAYVEEGTRGLLKKAMHGTRHATQNLEEECTEMLLETGFVQGRFSARVFYHEQEKVRIFAHGDDFTILGESESLDWLREVTQKRMEVKFKGRLK